MADDTTTDTPVNDLPDSAFAHIEAGGVKDGSGKTVPRSSRHFPIHTETAVRGSLSQIGKGADFAKEATPKVEAAAKKFGIQTGGKSVPLRDMTMEHKSFVFKLDGPPDDEGRFTGYAAVFGNVDKGNDVIDVGATTKTVQENPVVPLFWSHNYGLVPIGTGTMSIDPTGKGVPIDGQLFLKTSELAREVYGAMQADAVKGLSVGYNTLKRSYKGAVRHLQEIAIGEVSLCPFPMNPLAEVDGLKAITRAFAESKDAGDVDSTMWAINAGSDFMSVLVQAGMMDVAQQVQTIIEGLAKNLFDSADAASDSTDLTPDEAMSDSPKVKAVKKLISALHSDTEPAKATRDDDGAAKSDEDDPSEPDASTLKAWADLKSAFTTT